MHGTPATLHLEDLWIRNVTITTGLVDAYSTSTLLGSSRAGQLDPSPFVTHHFALDQFEDAYTVFGNAADTGALKVVLTRDVTNKRRRAAAEASKYVTVSARSDPS